jgi:hypothetical protein
VTFTPTDTTDYNTASSTVSVTVNKANPVVTTWPTASTITYGQTLASSTLSGGSANTPGSFAFTNPTLVPGAGTAPQSVTFTPTDTADYTAVSGTVSVTVTGGLLSQPTIQSAAQFGNSFTFTWNTTPLEKYQIQYTTNLSQAIWLNLGDPITASGSTLIGSDALASWPTFYRVMVVP